MTRLPSTLTPHLSSQISHLRLRFHHTLRQQLVIFQKPHAHFCHSLTNTIQQNETISLSFPLQKNKKQKMEKMEQEIISKMKPGCQLGPSTQLCPKQILALANAVAAAAASNTQDCWRPQLMNRLKSLMLLLDPVKNKLVFSEEAFKIVCDAWSVLSDLQKKSHDGKDTSFVENEQNEKEEEEEPVSVCNENEQKKTPFDEKDNVSENKEKDSQESGDKTESDKKKTFWTVCPYCCYMYEYEKWCEECGLRCQNCRRAFHGVPVPEPRSDFLVEGKDEYFCGFGVFPLKYSVDGTTVCGGGMCKSHSGDAVIVISDSDDGEAMSVNNDARKVDKGKEEVVKGNAKSGEEGKAEERNGGKKRVHVKSVGRKSKLWRRPVKSRRVESMSELKAKGLDLNVKFGEGFRGDGHEVEIGSGTGDECLDSDLEFFEKHGDVFVGFKFDG